MKNKVNIKTILMFVLILFAIVFPFIFETPYIVHIAIFTFYMAGSSLAWSVLGGLTGQISLGHASFMALGAYSSTLFLMHFNISPWLSIPIVFIVIGGISALIMYPTFILRGPYFTLVRLRFKNDKRRRRNCECNWHQSLKIQAYRNIYKFRYDGCNGSVLC